MYGHIWNRRLLVAALAGLILASIALTGCRQEEQHQKKEVPRNVRVLSLGTSELQEFVEVSGPVSPVRGADLSAQESGPVVALTVYKGQTVAAGEIVVEQDRAILKAERDAARSALETQAYNVDKIRRLHEAGKVNTLELLTAEQQFAQSKATADIAGERFDRAGVRAPFAGVVVDRFVELGELVQPGQRIARVIDPYVLKLEAHLTSAEVGWLEVGSPAEVQLGDNGRRAAGVVSWIGFEADRMTGKFKVEIEIDNSELRYNSGVIGRARVPKNRVAEAVAIPRDAVLPGRTGPTAFVVDGERARLRRLTLGVDQGLMVVVTSGLQPGEELVVRGHRELRDGSLVKITERTTNGDGSLDSDPAVVTGRSDTAGVHEDHAADLNTSRSAAAADDAEASE